jgi:hypothetical protein
MSARKRILRELDRLYGGDGSGRYARPSAIAGFTAHEAKYRAAVNQLLQDRMIDGMRGPDGHIVIALNSHRLSDVRKELRPWWASPLFWTIGTLIVGLTATGLLI